MASSKSVEGSGTANGEKTPSIVVTGSALRIRAERKCGLMLSEMKQNGECKTEISGRPKKRRMPRHISPRSRIWALPAIRSSKWQQLAAIPEAKFERAVIDSFRVCVAHHSSRLEISIIPWYAPFASSIADLSARLFFDCFLRWSSTNESSCRWRSARIRPPTQLQTRRTGISAAIPQNFLLRVRYGAAFL